MDTTARDLFEKLKGQFKNLTLGREDGTRTLIPGEASFFEFDYHSDESKLGSVVVSLVDESSLKVYFANNIMDDADSESKDKWYGFLRGLRKFSTQNMLNYEAKNISKARLDKGDFEYLSKQNKTEEELTMESKLYGSKRNSYQDCNGAKLIVQHTKTVDEDKMGSRSRNIRAVYIENSDGERFKFENTYLPGARAMARHVSNGGYPRDEHGAHISEIMSEMSELRGFVRGVKGKEDYVNEDAQDIIEKATGRYYGLKSTLESISKQRGYTDYFDNYEPTNFEVSEDDINDLKQKLTREVFDSKLEGSLGAVGKAMKHSNQLQEKKSDGKFYDYPQWEKAAKRENADIIDGDIEDLGSKQEVTMYKIAMNGNQELGTWVQYQQDLDDPKTGQSVTVPGYGEFAAQAGDGDSGDTDEREFIVPDSLELNPNKKTIPKKTMKYTSKEDVLNIVLTDIASLALDDDVANFAGKMAQTVSSVGTTFGQDPKDPAFIADKKKAVALANMYIKQVNSRRDDVEEDEVDFEETTATDPFDAYAESIDAIVDEGGFNKDGSYNTSDDEANEFDEYEADDDAKPDFLDLDGDGDTEEPMKKAASDKRQSTSRRNMGKGKPIDKDKFFGKKKAVTEYGGTEHMQDVESTAERMAELVEQGMDEDEAIMKAIEENEYLHIGFDKEEVIDAYQDTMSETTDTVKEGTWHIDAEGLKELMATGEPILVKDVEQYIGDDELSDEIANLQPDDDARMFIKDAMKRLGIEENTYEAVEEDDMAWLKKAAGIGSGAKSNHGIHEGEEGYQITPRSLVAREMRKLQDIAKD